ncbi:fasciclin domain-containing protein [Aquimarina brevivitae]|uniref:Putative surface protein with fasciclin (FAS1) repeats n=1 Tax=Aquimarina brevivitae TaxID=323412 RepID=A0A4Q7PIF1_9FLAO|nr:fasciclin domain-containing protein [Aquimarina brevivitae]RZT00357.1 putative surface protein with fasciclin (FAS1) repeats [Aquimarina brevivitae]
MKFILKPLKVFLVLTLFFGMYACDDDDNDNVIEIEASISALVQADNNLGALADALFEANLISEFEGTTEYTLLAPTNQAFTAFLLDNGWDNVSEIPDETLRKILLNHVIPGTYPASELNSQTTGYLTTASNAGPNNTNVSTFFNALSGVSFNGGSSNGGATVDEADIVATNGIIHIVDAVIQLPDVTTFAAADPEFSTLVSALTDSTPSTDFIGILSRDEGEYVDGINPPFTVFAPINSGFDAITLPTEEGEVAAILQTHVVTNANLTSATLTNGTVTTLNGDVTIDTTGPTLEGAGNTSATAILTTDIQATNGVIHVIEEVLLPAN